MAQRSGSEPPTTAPHDHLQPVVTSAEIERLQAEAQEKLLRAQALAEAQQAQSQLIPSDSTSTQSTNKEYSDSLRTRFPAVELIEFKGQGNKRKYREVREVLLTLLQLIDGSSNPTQHGQLLSTAIDQVVKVLKQARIADKYSWDVVDEVEQAPYFDNPDEERVYKKAKKSVDERREQLKAKPKAAIYSSSSSFRFTSAPRRDQPTPLFSNKRPSQRSQSSGGKCWGCDSPDHYQRDCPKRFRPQSQGRRF